MKTETINKMLSDEKNHLEKLHKIVKDSINAEELLIHNLSNPEKENLSFSDKLSDKVAFFGGSWEFIISFFMMFIRFAIIAYCTRYLVFVKCNSSRSRRHRFWILGGLDLLWIMAPFLLARIVQGRRLVQGALAFA